VIAPVLPVGLVALPRSVHHAREDEYSCDEDETFFNKEKS
jgi:hypothetical protein